jgi:hypothetical protein
MYTFCAGGVYLEGGLKDPSGGRLWPWYGGRPLPLLPPRAKGGPLPRIIEIQIQSRNPIKSKIWLGGFADAFCLYCRFHTDWGTTADFGPGIGCCPGRQMVIQRLETSAANCCVICPSVFAK